MRTGASAARTPTSKSAPTPKAPPAAAAPARAAHVDSKVAARNVSAHSHPNWVAAETTRWCADRSSQSATYPQAALNIAGGVKVDVFIRVRPRLPVDGSGEDIAKVDANEITVSDAKGADVFKFDKVCVAAVRRG